MIFRFGIIAQAVCNTLLMDSFVTPQILLCHLSLIVICGRLVLQTLILIAEEELQGHMAACHQFGKECREELSEDAGRMPIGS